MPILAITVTTIECDGSNGSLCPTGAVIEYRHPQSIAIRLARQTGWCLCIQTCCPDCSSEPASMEAVTPLAPAPTARAAEEFLPWRVPVTV